MPPRQVVLKLGDVFAICDERGDISPTESGSGLYFLDTRYLCLCTFSLNGLPLDLLDSTDDDIYESTAYFASPTIQNGQLDVPAGALSVRRKRRIDQGLVEEITVESYVISPLSLDLEFFLGADFRDIFDVRGFRSPRRGTYLRPEAIGDSVLLHYQARDGLIQQTVIRFSRSPDEVALDAHQTDESPSGNRVTDVRALFRLQLDQCGSTTIKLRVRPAVRDPNRAAANGKSVVAAPVRVSAVQRGRRLTALSPDHDLLYRALDRSLRNIESLLTPFPGGELLAAGVPWYVAPFGRDSLIAALQLLMFTPDIAITSSGSARWHG